MPENAGRKFGKGELYQHNVLNLVKALLRLAKGDLTLDDSQLKAAVQVVWVAQNKLQVTGEYKKTTKTGERVFEGTTKQDLWQLVGKTGTPLQLPQRQRDDSSTNAATRQADVVQNALYYLEDLGVLQDERPKNKRNTRYWIFTLTLKDEKASIEENLDVVEQKLQVETGQTSPDTSSPTDKSIIWRDVCRAMLEKQKRLTTNELLSADEDMKFELNDIHVPLALVQRTKPDKRSGDVSPEEGSRLLQPSYEEKQRFRHEEFLAQVLQEGKGQSKGRRIAVIGEPGAGKTTLLQSIAFWLFEDKNKNLGLPIWISLADLQGKTLEEYLLQRWLKNALEVARVSPEQENALVELFKKERVWLFLDGVDEIAGDSGLVGARHVVPLQMVASQLEGWVAKARVVLSCRLNVWEANINALGDDFETYRLLDFDYPLQVKEFICRWFRKTDTDKGERLWTELDKSERQRIQDLVKNPLRLALLCSTWQSSDKGLPSTKAGLYQRFVEVFYTWKKNRFRTTFEERQELNAALGRLALRAIDSSESRFRLRHKVVCEVLGDPEQENSLFGLALQLGWLNQVGLAAESETQEKVYAFYHPTFQEYFAALAIADWDFFLPRAHNNHNPKPVSERYRIFEPHWKEVILLWLGRPDEEVDKKHKEEFITALVEFEDGCKEYFFGYKGFYEYRAYLLAAVWIVELTEYNSANQIVKQLVKWSFGEFNVRYQLWQAKAPRKIAEKVKGILPETHRASVVTALIDLMHTNPDEYTRIEAAEVLGKIEPGHPEAINTLLEIMHSSPDEGWNIKALKTLGKIGRGNQKAIAVLVDLIHTSPDKLTTRMAASSLSQIDPEHPEAIAVPVRLGQINPNKPEWIAALVDQVKSNPTDEREEFNRLWAVQHLKASDTSDSKASAALIDLIRSNPNEDTLGEAVMSLGRIGKSDPEAIDLLIELSCKSQNWVIRWRAVQGLRYADTSHEKVIWVLIELIRTSSDHQIRSEAAQSLEQILQRHPLRLAVSDLKNTLPTQINDIKNDLHLYEKCYDVLLHSAQNMTYSAFYQAWHQHQQEEVGNTTTPNSSSLNQADLPQSLHSAIANDPQLSQIIHLICIDGSQFIDPDRPAAEIYDQMLDQKCPECNPVPETMPALKLYWNSLKRKSDKRVVLVFYASSTDATRDKDTAMPCPYSEAFLTVLSKFGREICVIAEQRFDRIPLKFFAPSQAIADLVEWIRENVVVD